MKDEGRMMEEHGEKPYDIRERTFKYSLRAIKVFQTLQKGENRAGWILTKQLLRSATSVGANIEEAQSAVSRKDFVHKYGIARKEIRESLYWLRLLTESGIVPKDKLEHLIKETEELIAIITTIIMNAKKKEDK